jgi:hypothetical protein
MQLWGSALAVAFVNIAREDRHRPGQDFRKGIRDKIRRAIVVTDVHSQVMMVDDDDDDDDDDES